MAISLELLLICDFRKRWPEMVMRLRWLAFWTRDIALGEGDEKFIVGDSGSLASRCLSLVQLVMAMNSPSSATE
nr:hypothetical protein Iba_chr04eCG17740 [Ipomoea batatas]GMD05980.1 hypothetical protein Iba_chr06bCG11610 [Ipomoea batatas]GMD08120.1 hypothetical protein Iba_chr06cCG13690 [Ipomoea batatas]